MKVRIDYTTREVVVLEGGTVFQHSHNIDYIQIAIDQYTPGLVYKLNFTDPSGNKNLSRYLDYIGTSNDLHYFKLPLNSTNTAYEGDLAMSMAIFTQTIEGDVTTTTKIWNSETFYQYIDASEEDETVDIEAEETTIIDEIYAAIALKLNIAHKGYYKASDFSLSGTMTTDAYVTAVYNALTDTEGNYILDTIAHILNDSVTLSDLPSGASDVLLTLQFETSAGTAAKRAQLVARGSVASDYIYYGFVNSGADSGFTGWKRYANNDDLDLKANLSGANLFDGNQVINGRLMARSLEIDEDIDMTSGKITHLANGTNAGDAVNKSQLDLKADKTYTDTELAKKADLAGGNTFEGNQTVNGTINAAGIVVVNASITSQLNKNNTKIVNLGNGSNPGDAVNKGQLDLKENLSNKVNEVVPGVTTDQYVNAAALYWKFLTKVDKAFTIAGLDMQSGSITKAALKAAIGEATTAANGLLSASDKTLIDVLRASYSDDDGNDAVDTIKEVLRAFDGFPETTELMAYFATKVDKVVGKGLSENDLTDILKTQYDDAVVHANKTDGTNPHLTTYANIVSKPTTRDGFGITDVYTKPETYTQLEINNLLDNLSAVKGLKSTLLTPTELSNGDTISTNLLTNNGAYIIFTATDTSTGEIDSDTVPVSTIITGKKFVFFDNQEIVFTIGETNSTFETSEAITLKINLLYLDDENVQAISVDFDGSLTNYLLTQTNVQEAIEQLDNELKTIVGDIDTILDSILGV